MFAPDGRTGTAILARLSMFLPERARELSVAGLWNPEPSVDSLPIEQSKRVDALSRLLGLLRAGEQSAAAAFGQLIRRLHPAAAECARVALQSIQADEARHDWILAKASDDSGISPAPPAKVARRFFATLESRDLGVHLGRIAALDACVCQVLSCVLSTTHHSTLPAPIVETLESIRRDEGRHVKIARTLARGLGVDDRTLQCVDVETRNAFDRVLHSYEPALVVLLADAEALRRRIRRVEC